MNQEDSKINLSVLVLSFDGYKDVWESFNKVFNMYWDDCPFPVYLTTNHETPRLKNINIIQTGEEINWCTRAMKALDSIESEYVLVLLEDYFIGKKVNNAEIEKALEFLDSKKPDYVRLVNIPKKRFKSGREKIQNLYKNEEYGINLQASVWKKDYLYESLKKVNGSAWDFEIFYLKQTMDAEHEIMNKAYATTTDILDIHNGVLKGKWMPKTINFFKRKGIIINMSDRGYLSKKQEIKYYTSAYLRDSLPYSIRKKMKKVLMKCNIKFTTKH